MKRRIPALAALLFTVALVAPAASAAASPASKGHRPSWGHRGHHRTILEFDTMAPVIEPFTGPTNAVRGVPGGGLPWEIDAAKGELSSDGRLNVEVRGLVLARRAPVPEERQGTNPVPSFKAIVSCLTSKDGEPATVNVSTEPAPATSTGDSRIRGRVELPSPCFAPIVFVTSPDGAWFATTGS